jgi:superfamily II RNA helicase
VGSVLLYSEELYDFGPHELAAALSCLVADMSRPDLYVAVEPSEKVSLFTMNALDMQTRVVAAQLSHGIRCVPPDDCVSISPPPL